MLLVKLVAEAAAPFVDFVYPPRCPACGDAIAQQTGLCGTCWSLIEPPSEPCCQLCQVPVEDDGRIDRRVCKSCSIETPKHDGIVAATRYNATSRSLILAFKHGGRIALAKLLSRLIASRLPAPEKGILLVPVPLHRWRLLSRGYNQSALLAKELARLGHGQVLVDALIRQKPTPSLGGSNAAQRKVILQNAIKINRRHRTVLEGAHVILVDDVLTTGATTSACVEALKGAGVASVKIACVARAFGSDTKTPEVQDPGR